MHRCATRSTPLRSAQDDTLGGSSGGILTDKLQFSKINQKRNQGYGATGELSFSHRTPQRVILNGELPCEPCEGSFLRSKIYLKDQKNYNTKHKKIQNIRKKADVLQKNKRPRLS